MVARRNVFWEQQRSEPAPATRAAGVPELAALDAVDADGRVRVSISGSRGSVFARVASHLDRAILQEALEQRTDVLVHFSGGDRSRPVIVGLVEERARLVPVAPVVSAAVPDGANAAEADAGSEFVATVDGRRVRIAGRDEIVLECGKASITLRRNGRIVVRGTHVETDSDGVNRIKGASVRIN